MTASNQPSITDSTNAAPTFSNRKLRAQRTTKTENESKLRGKQSAFKRIYIFITCCALQAQPPYKTGANNLLFKAHSGKNGRTKSFYEIQS